MKLKFDNFETLKKGKSDISYQCVDASIAGETDKVSENFASKWPIILSKKRQKIYRGLRGVFRFTQFFFPKRKKFS